MPLAALKPCSYCHVKLEVRGNHGRCEDHPYIITHIPEHQHLYNSRKWKRRRAAQLAKEPWCADCLLEKVYTPATIAHHIVPHRGDPVKFYTGPLMSLCKTCHDRRSPDELGIGRGDQKVLNRRAASGRGL